MLPCPVRYSPINRKYVPYTLIRMRLPPASGRRLRAHKRPAILSAIALSRYTPAYSAYAAVCWEICADRLPS